jgi:predicted protein tyrosine phosphatase
MSSSSVATRIGICSIDSLASAIAHWQPDAVISAFSPSSRLQVDRFERRRHLVLLFHDIESRIIYASNKGRMVGPSSRHIERVVEFLRERPERLLIHCTAGLSRSPALAMVAICEIYGDIAAACTSVKSALPEASPNRGVLRRADEVLKLGGRLVEQAMIVFPERKIAIERTSFVELNIDNSSDAATPLAVLPGVLPP